MANARRKKVMLGRSEAVATGKAAAAPKKTARKTVRATTSKRAKRATKVVRPGAAYAADHGQMTAFHHMQRASVVMSLMEKNTGKDLRRLLQRGVELYRKAMEEEAKEKNVLRAIGVLRAVEHL